MATAHWHNFISNNENCVMQNYPGDSSQPRKLPPAETGNASNPSPNNGSNESVDERQILNEKAEKYLREVSSIEDEPDARDQEDMNEILRENRK